MAQIEVKLPHKQSAGAAPAPVMYGASTVPVPSAGSMSAPDKDGEARRAAALAKLQGKQVPAAVAAPAITSARQVGPVMYSTSTVPAPTPIEEEMGPPTTVTVNGLDVQRSVRPGRGQVGSELFTPVAELHYVQFAVYCKDTPVDKAPPIEGLYLLWHPGSTCPGGAKGASYIVKGYNSAQEAKAAVASFRAKGIECWYNPALTGAEVEIIGVR